MREVLVQRTSATADEQSAEPRAWASSRSFYCVERRCALVYDGVRTSQIHTALHEKMNVPAQVLTPDWVLQVEVARRQRPDHRPAVSTSVPMSAKTTARSALPRPTACIGPGDQLI